MLCLPPQDLRDEEAARSGSDADPANEVPEEFLDPLLSTIMTVSPKMR